MKKDPPKNKKEVLTVWRANEEIVNNPFCPQCFLPQELELVSYGVKLQCDYCGFWFTAGLGAR
jgi:hypothetical protein